MGNDGTMEDVPLKVEKKNKSKSKKREKNEESSTGMDGVQSIGTVKETEHIRSSENEDIAERKKQRKRDKEEKKKNKGIEDTKEVEIEKKGTKESKGGFYAEDGKEDVTDNAERKKQRKRDKEKKKNKGIEDIKEVETEKKGTKESKGGVYAEDGKEDATDNVKRKSKKKEKKSKIEGNEGEKWLEEESISGVESGKETNKEKKKKEKAMRNHEDGDIENVGEKEGGQEVRAHSEKSEVNVTEMVETKKRKREKQRRTTESEKMSETLNETHHEDFAEKTEKKKKKRTREENDEGDVQSNEYNGNVAEKHESRKKRKKDSVDSDSNRVEHADKGKKKKKKSILVDKDSKTPNKSNKKVRFSGEDEVFTLPDLSDNAVGDYSEDGLLRGKRFSPEEDEIIKEAVHKYIREKDLGDEGLYMVLNSSKFLDRLNGVWKEIGSAIPYRPYSAVYSRAQVLFRRSDERKWTQDEYEYVLRYQEEHGNQWSALAAQMGKHRWHVKDTWRRIKLKNTKRGHWTQSEYQQLFDLVNNDLKLKLTEKKKSKHGMLRDNISWGAISDELDTRFAASCCGKWYDQLTSRMVANGEWADTDDYRLIGALYDLDATCIEDVDWDDLIEGRSGEVCRKRWDQMYMHIGHHGYKSFAEQVEVLAQRYCPHNLEAREIWDSKPRVP